MNFDTYQVKASKYDMAEAKMDVNHAGLVEKIFGISGEAGEVTDKFKKILRDRGGKLTEEDVQEISKELGDILWYLASVARYMGVSFEKIASDNLEKLESRYNRGKISGSGDNR